MRTDQEFDRFVAADLQFAPLARSCLEAQQMRTDLEFDKIEVVLQSAPAAQSCFVCRNLELCLKAQQMRTDLEFDKSVEVVLQLTLVAKSCFVCTNLELRLEAPQMCTRMKSCFGCRSLVLVAQLRQILSE
jgi:hypothetical protein